MVYIGVPSMLILAPLHWLAGGNAAGADHLSWLGFANVEEGSWVCWVHALFVWYTVCVVQWLQFEAQKKLFMPRREKWLMEMPMPRSNTVMVENIPPDQRTVDQLIAFFNTIFGAGGQEAKDGVVE